MFVCRYQLFLQIKHDVLQGRLPVSFELAAELGAFVVQCKCTNCISTKPTFTETHFPGDQLINTTFGRNQLILTLQSIKLLHAVIN